MLSPVVKTVPGMLSSSAAVASSFCVPQFAMFPAPTNTSDGVVVVAALGGGTCLGGLTMCSSDAHASAIVRATHVTDLGQGKRYSRLIGLLGKLAGQNRAHKIREPDRHVAPQCGCDPI